MTKGAHQRPLDRQAAFVDDAALDDRRAREPDGHRGFRGAVPQGPSGHESVCLDVQGVVVTDDADELKPATPVAPNAAGVEPKHPGRDRYLSVLDRTVGARIDDPSRQGPASDELHPERPARAGIQNQAFDRWSDQPSLRGPQLVDSCRDVRPMKAPVGRASHRARRPEPTSCQRDDRPFEGLGALIINSPRQRRRSRIELRGGDNSRPRGSARFYGEFAFSVVGAWNYEGPEHQKPSHCARHSHPAWFYL